jgi:hypothetical protein
MKSVKDNQQPPTLNGHPLSEQDLEWLRQHMESFDRIENISDDMRELIAERWPHMLAKLKSPPTE